ncbi:MAG: class I SAM-dependent methyltransferase [Labilithrix sp.]|nr:class I SAM-dependent methyltransferase [Labilithrix sp.]
MATTQASHTALMIAAYRARATAAEGALISDPWAAALAGEDGMRIARELDAVYPHMELWTAVRTALLDDLVETYTSPPHDFRQVIMLGAGLDTRAARLAKGGVRFYEVDQPKTQAEKRKRIEALPGYPKGAAIFVECDFERDALAEKLTLAGVDLGAPALVIWEGVTPYLVEAAVRATLRAIATTLHPRSVVVFDHLLKKQAEQKEHAQGYVQRLGEPVVFGTNDPVPMLYEEGFRHVRSLSFDEACLSLTGTYAREREFRFQRIVLASATAPARPSTI